MKNVLGCILVNRTVFLPVLLLLFAVSCTRDSNPFVSNTGSNIFSEGRPANPIQSKLPLNLDAYNQNPKTKIVGKSFGEDSSQGPLLDSLLDHTQTREHHFEETGWIYVEIPFKYNGSLAASLTKASDKNFGDSIVPIKSYYILAGNGTENKLVKYVVTMIPAKHYYIRNKNFSFLSKIDYSGVILYSSPAGEYIRGENYDRGCIVFSGLVARNESYTKRTKAGTEDDAIDGGWLNGIKIVADRIPDWQSNARELREWFEKWADDNISLDIQPALDYFASEDISGSGGSTRNKETYYTISYTKNICGKIYRGSKNIQRGSVFTESTPLSNKSGCLFMCWIADPVQYSTSANEIEFYPKHNVTLEAKYTSKEHNKDCYELMRLLYKESRLYMLSIIYNGFSKNHEFGGDWNGKDAVTFIGKDCKIDIAPRDGDVVKGISHSHNKSEHPFPSHDDFANFCYWYIQSGYYKDFIFDITCQNSKGDFCSMLLEVEDGEKFNRKAGDYNFDKKSIYEDYKR